MLIKANGQQIMKKPDQQSYDFLLGDFIWDWL